MADDEKKAAEPADGDERRKKRTRSRSRNRSRNRSQAATPRAQEGRNCQGGQPVAAVRPGSGKSAARTEQTGGQTADRCSGRTAPSSSPHQTTGQGGCTSGPERAEA